MKLYHMRANTDPYWENGVKHYISLPEGEVSLEEFSKYCEIFTNKVDYAVICIDHIENDTVYFYSDIV